MGRPDYLDIVLVAHGQALEAFDTKHAPAASFEGVCVLRRHAVDCAACGNTLRKSRTDITDLVDGFVRVAQGRVVRFAELQQEGYIRIRP
ncbi:hypothetical protein [Accumulibacter sp.]|uniref:DsrE family protein n=1 Tax=Accumulibacter sp. TaxID=2053492 RepID=UPI0025D906A9|nr:hypothetical protein [Accumulibacter sp.]MCM8624385.1 hypothetical protein [Accumulibacter sp.]